MSGRVASEDELGQKWDRCLADAIVKTGRSTFMPYALDTYFSFSSFCVSIPTILNRAPLVQYV